MTYRDRQGREIALLEWAHLRKNMSYRVVAEDQVGDVMVRTVWEGIETTPGVAFATGTSTGAPSGRTHAPNKKPESSTTTWLKSCARPRSAGHPTSANGPVSRW